MPTTFTSAKSTTLEVGEARAPVRARTASRSTRAPVSTFERRSQPLRNIIRKIWLNTGHSNGSQMLFRP